MILPRCNQFILSWNFIFFSLHTFFSLYISTSPIFTNWSQKLFSTVYLDGIIDVIVMYSILFPGKTDEWLWGKQFKNLCIAHLQVCFYRYLFYMNRFSKSHCEYNAKAWSLKCGSESSNIHTKRATSFPIPALITWFGLRNGRHGVIIGLGYRCYMSWKAINRQSWKIT